jgi:transposase
MLPEALESLNETSPPTSASIGALLDRLDALLASQKLLLAKNDELLSTNVAMLAEIARLNARIAELEAKTGAPPKTPDNSSVPPSSGQKSNVPEATAAKGKRKGRPGVARELAADPDVTRDIRADSCACGTALSDANSIGTHDYDHIDLPIINPTVTRIRLHTCVCPGCAKRVVAEAPADMKPGSPFGPNIVSLAVYLHAQQMISYARLVEVFHGVFGLQISEGAIANMLARCEAPFAAEADAVAARVRASAAIASDETSARVKGKTWWQWTFVTAFAVYHLIAPSRGRKVVVEFLAGQRPKAWTSDRLAAQGRHAEAHQYCLQHLIRDAQYAADAGDKIFAAKFKHFLQIACAVGRRRPNMSDAQMARHAQRLAGVCDRLLALVPSNIEGRKLRDAIDLEARDKLLVFMARRDVEPTNNASEQALRMSVIFRKVTNGFRSNWGAKVYADVCSIVATGKRAGKTALAAIKAALARPVSA